MITKTKIKLGKLELDGYQLEDGSYAAPGLYRLMDTFVYRYEDFWYCLNPEVPPALGKYDFWDCAIEAFLAFEGNQFSYIFMRPVDPEIGMDDGPVKIDCKPLLGVNEVIDFCIQLKILPDEVISRLRMVHNQCYELEDPLSRKASADDLIRDTCVHLFNWTWLG